MNAVANLLKSFSSMAQSDVRSNEERERDIENMAAAAELGLDIWDKETEIGKSDDDASRKQDIADSIAHAKTLSGDELMDFLEELENYYDGEDGKWKGNGAGFVARYIIKDGGIALPY